MQMGDVIVEKGKVLKVYFVCATAAFFCFADLLFVPFWKKLLIVFIAKKQHYKEPPPLKKINKMRWPGLRKKFKDSEERKTL